MEPISSSLEISQFLTSILNSIAIILTLLIGVKAFQKVTGTAGKLIGIGATLKVISSLGRYILKFFLSSSGYSEGIEYLIFNSYIGRIGNILFLIGIFMLVKNLLIEQDPTD